MTCIDPFGAAEYLVDDIGFRQMVGTELIRLGFFSREGNEQILRVKLVFPLTRLFEAQSETLAFLRHQDRRQRVAMM